MVKHQNNATIVVDFTYIPIILDTYIHQIYLQKSHQIFTKDIYRVKDFLGQEIPYRVLYALNDVKKDTI